MKAPSSVKRPNGPKNNAERNARKANNSKMPTAKPKAGVKSSGRVVTPDLAHTIQSMNKGGKGRT